MRTILITLIVSLVACTSSTPPPATPTATSIPADCSACESRSASLQARLANADVLAQKRQALFDQLTESLSALIGDGKVTVTFRSGLIVVQLPNEILFELGKTTFSTEGASTLGQVAPALTDIKEARLLIAGHTDNIPVDRKTKLYKSNWDLSTMRGLAVLRVLVNSGVAPERIAAAGFGEYDPIEANDDPESRSKNRRTEIVLVPNLEGLFSGLAGAN